MNARDESFSPEVTKTKSEDKQSPFFRVGRHDALLIVNAGGLPIESGLHRVVLVNRKSDGVFLLKFPGKQEVNEVSTGNKRVKQRLHMPTCVSLTALEAMTGKRWVVKTRAPVPRRLNKDVEDLTEFEKKVKTRRKQLISSFSSDEDLIRILEGGEMGGYVQRAVDKHNATLTDSDKKLTRYHVYQVVYRYWLHSCRESAIIPDSGNCGAPGTYRNPGDALRGRPPTRIITGHDLDRPQLNTGPETRDLIWLAWNQFGGKMGKYAEPHQKMVETYFTSGWKENDEGIWVPDKETIVDAPSLEVFRYYVKRKYEPVELLKKLIPSITWEQTKRAIKGRAHDKLFGPAHTFMIDSTIADVYLVSRFNRNWIIGRPVVYFVRDVFSGMIVGLHVALEGPSWHTARFALFNAFSPKGEFLRFHGFNMTDAAWPCAHGAMNLVHDRGESLSIPSTDSARDLGLILSACPSFRPDLKGPIETLFHWIRNETVRWLPGAVRSRGRERGERDYRLDAKLTMYQFTRILIHSVLMFNRNADVSDRFDSAMEEAGVENNPQALWLWGLDNLNGSPPQWDKDTLYKTLLPSGEAYIREDGVHFAGRRFEGAFSDKEKWKEFSRAFHNRKIKVKHDTVRPEEIHVLNEATGIYETLTLAKGEKVPANSRLEEILDQKMYRRLVKEDDKDIRLLDRIGHAKFFQNEIDLATVAKDAEVPPSSKAEHLAGITDKRWFEAQVQRLLDAAGAGRFLNDDSPSAPEQEAINTDETSLLSQLLAKAAEEMSHVAID